MHDVQRKERHATQQNATSERMTEELLEETAAAAAIFGG